jgi:hypothetical protein
MVMVSVQSENRPQCVIDRGHLRVAQSAGMLTESFLRVNHCELLNQHPSPLQDQYGL